MYESHVTVEGIDQEAFEKICRTIGAKAVVIDMDTGSNMKQMMTAKFHKTNDQFEALWDMTHIAAKFDHVIRRKLEYIIPKKHAPLPPHKYLEFHAKYELEFDQLDEFIDKVREVGGHTSRNVLKQFADGDRCYHFATARHQEVWDKMLEILSPYKRVNGIRECVVHDDNPDLDTNWYGCNGCFLKRI